MSADELAAAVEALGALPMPVPVGPEPLSPEREAEIREWVEAMGRKKDIRYYGSWQQHGELLGEIDRLRARVTELERTVQQMCDGLNGHDCPPPGESPMGLVTRFAVRLMEAERLVAELESGQAADGSYLPALPWAALMDDEDLAGFLDELAASAIVHATSEVALAEVENTCSTWRLIGEAQHGHSTAPGPDAVTTSYTATPEAHAQMRAALTRHFAGEPEPEFHTYLHHENRCPHDRPELGGLQ